MAAFERVGGAEPPSRRSRAFDVSLAVATTALLQASVWLGEEEGEVFEHRPLSAALMLLLTVPLVWRRSHPLAVAALNGAGRSAQAVVTGSWVATHGITLPTIVALYTVGAYAQGRRALAGLALIVGGLTVAAAYDLPDGEADLWNGLFFYLLAGFVFGLGVYVRGRRRARAAELQAERLERERADTARAIAEERARIARELHDVVAHSVSATVVQAEAAEEVLAAEPDRARQSLERIQRSGREALGEMRRLLGVMRAEDGDAALAPQPQLADVERLVGEARTDGLSVSLDVEGARRDLPAGVELSGYRIVQESLTNVRKHAGRPVRADVLIRYTPGVLEVEVADDGPGTQGGDGPGHGLLGMRERVAFFGGELEAGPRPGGGFRVRARIPLPPEGR